MADESIECFLTSTFGIAPPNVEDMHPIHPQLACVTEPSDDTPAITYMLSGDKDLHQSLLQGIDISNGDLPIEFPASMVQHGNYTIHIEEGTEQNIKFKDRRRRLGSLLPSSTGTFEVLLVRVGNIPQSKEQLFNDFFSDNNNLVSDSNNE